MLSCLVICRVVIINVSITFVNITYVTQVEILNDLNVYKSKLHYPFWIVFG